MRAVGSQDRRLMAELVFPRGSLDLALVDGEGRLISRSNWDLGEWQWPHLDTSSNPVYFFWVRSSHWWLGVWSNEDNSVTNWLAYDSGCTKGCLNLIYRNIGQWFGVSILVRAYYIFCGWLPCRPSCWHLGSCSWHDPICVRCLLHTPEYFLYTSPLETEIVKLPCGLLNSRFESKQPKYLTYCFHIHLWNMLSLIVWAWNWALKLLLNTHQTFCINLKVLIFSD